MKIGIITFWESGDNYGQLLQCWALQQQLKGMGHDPFLIKYHSTKKHPTSFSQKVGKVLKIYPVVLKITEYIKSKQNTRLARILERSNAQRQFNDFRRQKIISCETIYNSLESLQKNPPTADCYICGSDQIWSMILSNPENEAYYLNFGEKKIKRIAYAASFGRDVYPKEWNDKLRDMLLRFQAVSVREDSGVDICAKVGVKACRVLDPTLLIDSNSYATLIEPPKIDRNYFFTYSINVESKNGLCWNELMEYSSSNGLISISTTSSGYLPGRELCDNTSYIYATIPQWLGYIKYAQFVATTSFHGVVFSLIFRKNFIYFPLKGKFSKGNNRVLSLLNEIGLSDKVCWNEREVKRCIEIPIDWVNVEKKLSKMQAESKLFLNMYL